MNCGTSLGAWAKLHRDCKMYVNFHFLPWLMVIVNIVTVSNKYPWQEDLWSSDASGAAGVCWQRRGCGQSPLSCSTAACTCSTWLVSGGQLGQCVHLVHVSACGRLWTVQGHYLYHCSVQSVQPVRCDANCALVSTPGPTSIAVWSINPSSDLAVHGTQSGHPLKAIIET